MTLYSAASDISDNTQRANSSQVPAVTVAVRILEVLATRSNACALDELARIVGRPRSSVHRVLNTLIVEGMVEKGADGKGYCIGIGVIKLASAYGNRIEAISKFEAVAHPLVKEINETSQLAILDGFEAIFVAKVDSNRQVRLVTQIGKRVPAHASAVGKALLAFSNIDTKSEPSKIELKQVTTNTITDWNALTDQLDLIRQSGVALAVEESAENLTCVASPVFDISGRLVAAMSICVPERGVAPERITFLKAKVRESAQSVSAALGFSK